MRTWIKGGLIGGGIILLIFISVIVTARTMDSYFIDSNRQNCKEGFIEQKLPKPIVNNPLCVTETCDVKCVNAIRMSPEFCGEEFDIIDSNIDRCCNGLIMQELPRARSYEFIQCTSESGVCDVKCINPERIRNEQNKTIIVVILYAIFLISYISWIFIVGIMLFVRFWRVYYPNTSFITKYFSVGFKMGLCVLGLSSYEECQNCKKLIWQYRIGLIMFLIAFIGVVIFS